MIWFFGYMSTGHASVFDWDVVTPWWIPSFVPNLEAELGTCGHVRGHDPDSLARNTEARVTWLAYSPALPF
jgi:hypothetical protein